MNEDRRGYVPFAIIGVLILALSVGVVTSSSTSEVTQSPIDVAMDNAVAETNTNIRLAVDAAAQAAAAQPVITPANTSAGRAIDPDSPFEDALRLRIYLAIADRLDTVIVTRGDVTVTATLPPMRPTTEGYQTAISAITIDPAGSNGTALEVTVDSVEFTVTRDDGSVQTIRTQPTVVISNPVLTVHAQSEQFIDRLQRPVTRPGLDQRLTARLYPIAWARGLAQYGGAPISTVLGTRHIEVATNDALLAEQQAAFGSVDPAGIRGVSAASRRVATTDALAGIGAETDWTDIVLKTADTIGPDPPVDQPVGTWQEPPTDDNVFISLADEAQRAYATLVHPTSADKIDSFLERAHTVEADIQTSVDRRDRTERGSRSAGAGWSRENTRITIRWSISPRAGGYVSPPTGWEHIETRSFDVTRTRTAVRTWSRGNETTRTRHVIVRRYRVDITVVARPVPIPGVQNGHLHGSLERAAITAGTRTIEQAGGYRSLARKAASGSVDSDRVRVVAEPTVARSEIIRDLQSVYRQTRSIEVGVPAPAIGTGRVNPASSLRTELEANIETYHGPTGTTPEARTVRAVRLAYFEELMAALDIREQAHSETNSELESTLGRHLDRNRLDGALAAHRKATQPDDPQLSDPAGPLNLTVTTAPTYLTTEPVSRARIDVVGEGTVTPLATRNINLFTSPHAQVASSIVNRLPWFGTERVSLETAAMTLKVAETSDLQLDSESTLRSAVEDGDSYVRGALIRTLTDHGVPRTIASEAVASDEPVADRALAISNKSETPLIVHTVHQSDSSLDPYWLGHQLNQTIDQALRDEQALPPAPVTKEVAGTLKKQLGQDLEDTIETGVKTTIDTAKVRILGSQLAQLPAGLPVLPVPGYWIATANVWYVEVGGTYERVAIHADRGNPQGQLVYVREGQTSWIEHNGSSHRLGTADKISFSATTAVVVVVPPGPRGVGDTDGIMDERSPGWPHIPP